MEKQVLVAVDAVVAYAQDALAARADPVKAKQMAAYIYSKRYRELYGLKRRMPFFGVQKPGCVSILRHLKKEFVPQDRDEYEDLVVSMWSLPHREERYLAQGLAVAHKQFIVPASIPLYRRMITEGAWWDFVDETSNHMIRPLIIQYPEQTWPIIDGWIDDEIMWIRRAAIICQVGAKEHTDADRLFRFCARRAHEKEFFIRKAIGWALREHARTDPEAVAAFVLANRAELSGLSYREATKHIGELVR